MQDKFNYADAPSHFTKKARGADDRMWMHSDVEVIVRDKDGNLKSRSIQKNLRTNLGANYWNQQLFGAASATAIAKYMAITADATAPAAGDTTLASEQTTNGLARAAATVTHTANATSTQLSVTWTYTGAASLTLAKVGLFDATTAGNLVLETLLSATATVSANGDQVTVNWTVNF